MSCETTTERLPEWIRVKVHTGNNRKEVESELRDLHLNTVCEEAKCPNLAECWHERTATFMLMGSNCTRACRFCAIGYDKPSPLDPDEPARVATAAAKMGLDYVVITSVARDDLPDEGAAHFAETVGKVREKLPNSGIEILTPDFNGRTELIQVVLNAMPTVFNHNLETCERLSPPVRGRAKYRRSLKVHILTIGQYLPPSRKHWKLKRYVKPEKFDEWAAYAKKIGFKAVASSPMVRSSYKAGELIDNKVIEQQASVNSKN
jgi:lipoyl synthase